MIVMATVWTQRRAFSWLQEVRQLLERANKYITELVQQTKKIPEVGRNCTLLVVSILLSLWRRPTLGGLFCHASTK